MNTRNYHAHRRIKTCIWKYQNGDRYVPGWRATMRLSKSEVSAQLKDNFGHAIEQNKIKHAWQLNQSNNQSIMRKARMLGPHQSPFIFAGINITNPIILELWKYHSCLYKIKRNRRLFETRRELKLLERKLNFWNLFGNWSLENYLKIGVLRIKFKSWNFGMSNLKEIRILEIGN